MLFVVMNCTHGKSAPWYQTSAFPWCRSQCAVDCRQAEGFLYIDAAANFLGYPQGIMKSPRDHIKPFGSQTKKPYKSSIPWKQDGRDRNPIRHWRENWRPNKLEGKWCRTAMHHSFLRFALWKKKCDRNMVYGPVSVQKDHWFSQLCSDKCTSRLQTWHVVWCGDAYLSIGQQRWFICGDDCLSAFSWTKTDWCFQWNGTRDRLPC